MPYMVTDQGEGVDARYCVHKHDADGKPVGDPLGCHDTEEKAKAQMAALYASEKKFAFVKSRGPEVSVVAGWGVVFGGQDLTGETFLPDTDFMRGLVPEPWVFYDHALQNVKHALGTARVEAKSDGLWVEAQIDMHKEYAEEILSLVESGVLGWSSQAVGSLVIREGKTLKRWPIAEFSLTPTPCEPRTLGVEHVKTLFNEAGLPVPEALAEAPEGAPVREVESDPAAELVEALGLHPHEEVKDMADKVEETAAPDIGALVEAEVAKRFEKLAAEPLKEGGIALKTVAIKKVTELGFADDETKSFMYFLKTGDAVPYKAAMQGQTDSEGGYAVPDDFYNRVVEKRDELSVARRAGAQVIQTSLDRILVPTEGTSMTAFAITAEEGAVSEEEPTLGQVIITVHNATKLVKVSKQLLADQKANLEGFLQGAFGRAEAEWENTYFLEGGGTTEPLGVVDGGTVATAIAGSAAITAAEVVAHMHVLPEAYHGSNVAWSMRFGTLGAIRALSGTAFYFQVTPAGAVHPGLDLLGYPVYCSAQMATWGSATKPIVFGNWDFYMIAERQSMTIQRLDELYAGNGQVGLLASFRRGGAPTQAEAFRVALCAT